MSCLSCRTTSFKGSLNEWCLQLLESELKPQLVEMQQELEDYKAYQRAVSEVDTLEPLIRAYNYFTYLQQLETLHSRVEEAKEEDSQLDNDTEATQVRYILLSNPPLCVARMFRPSSCLDITCFDPF